MMKIKRFAEYFILDQINFVHWEYDCWLNNTSDQTGVEFQRSVCSAITAMSPREMLFRRRTVQWAGDTAVVRRPHAFQYSGRFRLYNPFTVGFQLPIDVFEHNLTVVWCTWLGPSPPISRSLPSDPSV